MRFSAVAALCAVPLALAGSLQADLAARGAISLEARMAGSSDDSYGSDGKGKDDSGNKNNKGDDNKGKDKDRGKDNNDVIVEETEITEVIIIWVNNGGNSPTSTVNAPMSYGSSGSSGSSGSNGASATHAVTVGGAAGLVYTPDTIEAAIGDMVIFTFLSKNHTATQSAFTTPCKFLEGGKDSGFMPNINNTVNPPPQMAMQVTVSTPIWFYCKQTGHCGKGMTFSINPTANKTQAMFQQMAIAQNGTGSSDAITGGSSDASTVSVAASAATDAASSDGSSDGSVVAGSGSINSGGSCDCSCFCGVASFPNAGIQGIGGFGGYSGSVPS